MEPVNKFSVNISGSNKFHLASWTNAYIDHSGACSATIFYPERDYYLHLGKSNQKLGDIYTYCLYYALSCSKISDQNVKENIRPIDDPIEKIKRISAYYYTLKEDFLPENISSEVKENLSKTQIGFIAQELEEEFPELVVVPTSENEYYSVNYIDMIPVLLEAIKEQQNQIEHQQQKLKMLQTIALSQECDVIELRQTINTLQELVYSCCSGSPKIHPIPSEESQIQEKALLYQNTPNPFTSNTEITCYIPIIHEKAFLYVYNLQGIELKAYPVTQIGLNSFTIQASELSAGMYLYTLVVDNEIIDSKRMILTR